MAIPGSGAISMSMFNTELGRTSNTANSSLAGGTTPAVGSLFWLANQSGSLNQTAPHAMSEWYGYATDTDFLLNLDASNGSSYSGEGNIWYDISGKENDGTLTNRSAIDPVWNESGWFEFVGSNVFGTYQNGRYVSTVDGAFARVSSQNRVSLSVWCYPTENSYPMILAGNSYNGSIGFQGYQIWLNAGNLYGRITVNNTTTYVDIGAAASFNAWNHCFLTYDGTNARFYKDNSIAGTSAISGTISNISPNRFLIGAQYNAQGATNTAEFYTGYISKVRLYSRVLSDSERTNIYDAGR